MAKTAVATKEAPAVIQTPEDLLACLEKVREDAAEARKAAVEARALSAATLTRLSAWAAAFQALGLGATVKQAGDLAYAVAREALAVADYAAELEQRP